MNEKLKKLFDKHLESYAKVERSLTNFTLAQEHLYALLTIKPEDAEPVIQFLDLYHDFFADITQLDFLKLQQFMAIQERFANIEQTTIPVRDVILAFFDMLVTEQTLFCKLHDLAIVESFLLIPLANKVTNLFRYVLINPQQRLNIAPIIGKNGTAEKFNLTHFTSQSLSIFHAIHKIDTSFQDIADFIIKNADALNFNQEDCNLTLLLADKFTNDHSELKRRLDFIQEDDFIKHIDEHIKKMAKISERYLSDNEPSSYVKANKFSNILSAFNKARNDYALDMIHLDQTEDKADLLLNVNLILKQQIKETMQQHYRDNLSTSITINLNIMFGLSETDQEELTKAKNFMLTAIKNFGKDVYKKNI